MDTVTEQSPQTTQAKYDSFMEQVRPLFDAASFNQLIKERELLITPPVESYTQPGFLMSDEILARQGPFIEVGGPTPYGFKSVNPDSLPKPLHTSNIQSGLPIYDVNTGQFLKSVGRIDFQADARRLPLTNNSVGAMFVSAPPEHMISPRSLLTECIRSLEPGGLVITQDVSVDFIAEATRQGLSLKAKKTYADDDANNYSYDAIFQKPKT